MGTSDQELDPLAEPIQAVYLRNAQSFQSFLKNKCSLELKISLTDSSEDIGPENNFGQNTTYFHANSIDELYMIFRNWNIFATLDLNYQVNIILRGVKVDGFLIFENYPDAFWDSIKIDTFEPQDRHKRGILAWNEGHLFLVRKNSYQRFHHPYSKISTGIGRFTPFGYEFLLNISPETEEIDNSHIFVSCHIENSQDTPEGRTPYRFKEIKRIKIRAAYFTKTFLKTHFLLIYKNKIEFLKIDLRSTYYDFPNHEFKPIGEVAYSRKNKMVIFNQEDNKTTIVDLIRKDIRIVDYHQIYSTNSFLDYFYYKKDSSIFCSLWSFPFKPLKELGSIPGSITITGRHIIAEITEPTAAHGRGGKKFVILKELNTFGLGNLDKASSPFSWVDLDLNPWKSRTIPMVLSSRQFDIFLKKRAEEKDRRFFVLLDCIASLDAQGRIMIYDWDTFEVVIDFKDLIISEIRFLLGAGIDLDNFNICEGSIKARKFIFYYRLIYFILTVHEGFTNTYQLVEYGDGVSIDSLVAANPDMSVILFNKDLNKIRGGEYLSEDPPDLKKFVLPSIDRKLLLSFSNSRANREMLDPLVVHNFLTLEKIFTISIFGRPQHPFAKVEFLYYKTDWDFCYFETANELFVFDNRKRLNVSEYLYLQNIVISKKDEIFRYQKTYSTVFENSMCLNLYIHPLLVSLFNLTNNDTVINQSIEYPTNIILNSPLLAASYHTTHSPLENTIMSIFKDGYRKNISTFNRSEFHMLLRQDRTITNKLLSWMIQRFEFYEGDYNQILEVRRKLPRKVVMINSSNKMFLPSTFAQLTGLRQVFHPIFVMKIDKRSTKSTDIANSSEQIKNPHDFVWLTGYFNTQDELAQTLLEEIIQDKAFNTNAPKLHYKIDKVSRYFRVNANADFSVGTLTSHLLLLLYKSTDDDEFVLSAYRYIIEEKWEKLRFLSWFQTVCFIMLVVCLTIYLFQPQLLPLYYICLILAGGFLLQETCNMVMGFKDYVTDYENYFDISGFILAVITVALTRRDEGAKISDEVLNLHVVTLHILYFRFFTYLKVFNFFTHVIVMIFEITGNVVDLLVVIAIVIVSLGVIATNTIYSHNFGLQIQLTFFSAWGNINNFTLQTPIQWIVNIIIGLFLSLLLINFLIAKMNNEYANLDKRREVLIYQYKAKLIHESEVSYRFKLIALNFFWRLKWLVGPGLKKFVAEPETGYTFLATNTKKFNFDQLQSKHSAYELDEYKKIVNLIRLDGSMVKSEFLKKFDKLEKDLDKMISDREMKNV